MGVMIMVCECADDGLWGCVRCCVMLVPWKWFVLVCEEWCVDDVMWCGGERCAVT